MRLEAKRLIFNENSSLRDERLKILNESGMDKYVETINSQKLLESQKQHEIAYVSLVP